LSGRETRGRSSLLPPRSQRERLSESTPSCFATSHKHTQPFSKRARLSLALPHSPPPHQPFAASLGYLLPLNAMFDLRTSQTSPALNSAATPNLGRLLFAHPAAIKMLAPLPPQQRAEEASAMYGTAGGRNESHCVEAASPSRGDDSFLRFSAGDEEDKLARTAVIALRRVQGSVRRSYKGEERTYESFQPRMAQTISLISSFLFSILLPQLCSSRL
jgi:hypothetical protein